MTIAMRGSAAPSVPAPNTLHTPMSAIRMQHISGSDVGRMARSRVERRTLFGALARRSRTWSRMVTRWHLADVATRRTDRRGRAYDRVWDGKLANKVLHGLYITGNARQVARALGVSSQTFYRHRQANPFFKVRWERQLMMRFQELEEILLERAVYGFEEEVWYRGQYLGKRVVYDHKLAMRLLELALARERVAKLYARQCRASADDAADYAYGEVNRQIRTAHMRRQITADDSAQGSALQRE